ncbi:prepilin peptidase [Rhizobium sp. L1K21]|uniref:A24 family peptidase n=1 Tax=Rhizobium sp. L1K21 TaxID=2954933 RepID=UPI0020923688|nr:prepilin peptidase [Rhizobium sp. L1K21]MCO6188242.1 prepilin peptidase [Rhizobium sp. L1K21]
MLGFDVFYICLALAVTAAIYDGVTGKIPNFITYPAILAGLSGWWVAGGVYGIGGSLAGLAFAAFPFLLAFIFGGCGGGDVKIMAAVGALLGFPGILPVLAHALAVGALMAIFMLLLHGRLRLFWERNVARLMMLRFGVWNAQELTAWNKASTSGEVGLQEGTVTIRFGIALGVAMVWLLFPALPRIPGL